jgi:hypothetical protein
MTRPYALTFRLAALAALAAFAACGEDPPVPGPGTLTATLVSPNGDEGAAIVALFGDGIQSISAVTPTEAYPRLDDDGARVVLINQGGGLLEFQVALADTLQKPDVLIIEVAAPDDELRTDTNAYTVEFTR